jgi:hypothetical protein
MIPAIIVYTHTDMKDIWPMFFGQFKKYVSTYKVYVCLNNKDESIPSEYTQITYNDSVTYTDRWVEILPKISEDVLLFMHEDMVLYDTPRFDLVEKYSEYVNSGVVNSVKLIYAGNDSIKSSIDSTLVKNGHSKFSVQPTIFRKELLENLVKSFPNKNIWEFEESIQETDLDYMVKLGGEPKRGIHHYDSFIWPYIATAINKGKWNMTEYSNELDKLFIEYKINPFERGIW